MIKIDRQRFLRHLQRIEKVASNNGFVLLTTSKNGVLTVKAFDYKSSCCADLKCDIEQDFTICLNFKTLYNTLKVETSDIFTLQINENEVIIHCNKNKYTLPTLDTTPFDGVCVLTEKHTICSVNPPLFIKALNSVSFCVSKDDMRPMLNGINLQISTEVTTLAASDAHILAETTFVNTSNVETTLLIQHDTASFLTSFFDLFDYIDICISKKNIVFIQNDDILQMRLIDAVFPAYKQLFPSFSICNFTASKKAIEGSLNALSIYANDTIFSATMYVDDSNQMLKVSTTDFDNNKSCDNFIDCEVMKLESNFSINFNIKMMLSIARSQLSDALNISITGDTSPFVFTYKDDTLSSRVLLMPLAKQH